MSEFSEYYFKIMAAYMHAFCMFYLHVQPGYTNYFKINPRLLLITLAMSTVNNHDKLIF